MLPCAKLYQDVRRNSSKGTKASGNPWKDTGDPLIRQVLLGVFKISVVSSFVKLIDGAQVALHMQVVCGSPPVQATSLGGWDTRETC